MYYHITDFSHFGYKAIYRVAQENPVISRMLRGFEKLAGESSITILPLGLARLRRVFSAANPPSRGIAYFVLRYITFTLIPRVSRYTQVFSGSRSGATIYGPFHAKLTRLKPFFSFN